MQGFARVVLVGHSYGCYLVSKLATEQPDRVAAMVLIGAGYPTPGFARMRWIFYLPTIVSALTSNRFLLLAPSIGPMSQLDMSDVWQASAKPVLSRTLRFLQGERTPCQMPHTIAPLASEQ